MDGDPQGADSVLLEVAREMMAISLRAAEAVPGGVSAVQLRALTVLSRLEQANLGDLGAALGMSPSSTSRLCDRLVSRGLIDRQVSRRTRREVELSLSPAGSRLLAEYDRHRLEALRAVIGGLAPRRRQEVLAALRDFAAAAGVTAVAVRQAGV
jgi:DNA-binding MarR family transcriptional regulator